MTERCALHRERHAARRGAVPFRAALAGFERRRKRGRDMGDTATMFCFQCEQTAGCTGCTGATGVCGKQASTAVLQDEVTGALVALARTVRAAGMNGDAGRTADDLAMEGWFATLTSVDFDDAAFADLLEGGQGEHDCVAAAAQVEAAPA